MKQAVIDGDVIETTRPYVEVTRRSRPDTNWHVVDALGHAHAWYVDGQPARTYDPTWSYELPTLTFVVDYVEYYEEDVPISHGHHECARCGERIEPGRKPDALTRPSGS
jgi:hypothetical protein